MPLGNRPGGEGADVVQHEVGPVLGEELPQHRGHREGVVEEDVLDRDRILRPPGGVAVERQRGVVRDVRGAGGRDRVGEGRRVDVAHPVAPGDELGDEGEARVDVAVGRNGSHDDMGGAGHLGGPLERLRLGLLSRRDGSSR